MVTNWERIVKFNDKHRPGYREWDPVRLSNNMQGEAGETFEDTVMLMFASTRVGELVKKITGGGTKKHKVTRADVAEECFDVYVYMVMLLTNLGFTEEEFNTVGFAKMMELYERMDDILPTEQL